MNATYQINSVNGELVIRDTETGEIIQRVPSSTTITAASDSWDVARECDLSGTITAVDHDADTIFATVELPAVMCGEQCTND